MPYYPCHCLGRNGKPKRSYSSETSARESARYRKARGAPPLRIYLCTDCGAYHLTST
jgi:hypothetical protein